MAPKHRAAVKQSRTLAKEPKRSICYDGKRCSGTGPPKRANAKEAFFDQVLSPVKEQYSSIARRLGAPTLTIDFDVVHVSREEAIAAAATLRSAEAWRVVTNKKAPSAELRAFMHHMNFYPDKPNGALPNQGSAEELLACCLPLVLIAAPHLRQHAHGFRGWPSPSPRDIPFISDLIEHVCTAHDISADRMAEQIDAMKVHTVYMGIFPPPVPLKRVCHIENSTSTGDANGFEKAFDVLRGATRFDPVKYPPGSTDRFIRISYPGQPDHVVDWSDIKLETTMAQLVQGRIDATVSFVRALKDDGAALRSRCVRQTFDV